VKVPLIGKIAVVALLATTTVIATVEPASAICEFDKSNQHTVGSVFHGWTRTFCQPAGNWVYTVSTDHGHGAKYAALWHTGATHLHCDSLVSGSGNASCSDTVGNTHHYSSHDVADPACGDRFGDGHGFDCHAMEGLP
jgi:hypothetical protein